MLALEPGAKTNVTDHSGDLAAVENAIRVFFERVGLERLGISSAVGQVIDTGSKLRYCIQTKFVVYVGRGAKRL